MIAACLTMGEKIIKSSSLSFVNFSLEWTVKWCATSVSMAPERFHSALAWCALCTNGTSRIYKFCCHSMAFIELSLGHRRILIRIYDLDLLKLKWRMRTVFECQNKGRECVLYLRTCTHNSLICKYLEFSAAHSECSREHSHNEWRHHLMVSFCAMPLLSQRCRRRDVHAAITFPEELLEAFKRATHSGNSACLLMLTNNCTWFFDFKLMRKFVENPIAHSGCMQCGIRMTFDKITYDPKLHRFLYGIRWLSQRWTSHSYGRSTAIFTMVIYCN